MPESCDVKVGVDIFSYSKDLFNQASAVFSTKFLTFI